jgi:hypothetical protein
MSEPLVRRRLLQAAEARALAAVLNAAEEMWERPARRRRRLRAAQVRVRSAALEMWERPELHPRPRAVEDRRARLDLSEP